MKPLCYLALIFIDAFGITHPTIEARDRAARYVAFLMIGFFGNCLLGFFLGSASPVRIVRTRLHIQQRMRSHNLIRR